MIDFRLFLDDHQVTDLPDEITNFETIIVRDSGIVSEDQIIRKKTDVSLTFFGDAYTYLCEHRKVDICKKVDVKIEYNCDGSTWKTLFEGIFYHKLAKVLPAKKIIESKIYDNSFSALIRERQDLKILLTVNKSVSDLDIDPATAIGVTFFNTVDGSDEPDPRNVYEVFEVFKFIVKYLTDDTIGVKSDYFTTGAGFNKYSITTGSMIRYGANSYQGDLGINNSSFIPEVTWKAFYLEIRKKLRIFTAVEYESDGTPYLRIEPESYFFKNNQLMNIVDIPLDLQEEFDKEEVYSNIQIGSTKTYVDESVFFNYPVGRLIAWQEESYGNCNECVLENTLDLVSDYIIDSNVIGEMLFGSYEEYLKDIFLIELDGNDPANVAKYDSVAYNSGAYHYNDLLNNENVLNNWSGGLPSCIVAYFDGEPCMEAELTTPITLQHNDPGGIGAGAGISIHPIDYDNEICDSAQAHTNTYNYDFEEDGQTINGGLTGSGYVAPFFGKYQFTVSVHANNRFGGTPPCFFSFGPLEEYEWELKLYVFENLGDATSGGTGLATSIYSSAKVQLHTLIACMEDAYDATLTINTPLIDLKPGNIVIPAFRIRTDLNGGTFSLRDMVELDLGTFQIDQADYIGYENLPQSNEQQKLLQWEFETIISECDFETISNNPYGYFTINGKNGWIKELKYIPGKLSTIKLLTDETLC